MPPTPPPAPVPTGDKVDATKGALLSDFVANRFFGFTDYASASAEDKSTIRILLKDFYDVAIDVDTVYENLQSDNLTTRQTNMLDKLLDDPAATNDFIKYYVNTIDNKGGGDDDANKLRGYKLQDLIAKYGEARSKVIDKNTASKDPYDLIRDKIKTGMGADFKPYFDYLDSDKQIRDLLLRPGKFRDDRGPASVNQFQCRIGGSTFFVPPTSINVHQGFKAGSLTGGVLRQPNSAKMNLGHSETSITLTLYFPNQETIWGFKGDNGDDLDIFNWDPQPVVRTDRAEIDTQIQVVKNPVADSVIDSYLSSFRGLVTQFKYSPILPIKNEYLNRTFDIDAVALRGMTVSTVPNFPYVIVVNIELSKYNYAPLMPMISDFDQAIHWGKFRQYMGRAASRLDSKINQGFLIEKPNSINRGGVPHDLPVITSDKPGPTIGTIGTLVSSEGDLLPQFNKSKDIADGRYFSFYYPLSDPARIFAPDTTDFRQPSEDATMTNDDWDFILSSVGLDVVSAPQFNFFEFDRTWRAAKYRSESKVLQQWLHAQNILWNGMTQDNLNKFIAKQIKDAGGTVNDSNKQAITEMYSAEWFNALYGAVLEQDPSLNLIKTSRNRNSSYTINEWEIPMEKLDVDWNNCIISGVSVSLSNNFAKLQVQLQDEPTYQHLGGGDSMVEVDMVLIGEDNLVKFRRMFEHINGLARIEKAHGVLGFLGVKNIITALCGIKYVLPIDFEVDTMPNFPHVYNVRMTFVDFDVMQQEREKLSSAQQKELVDTFGKRNPFLRLKQCWSAFNAYPDLPLDVRDENGKIVGHLDPDWYFRSFNTTNSDRDLFTWNMDPKVVKTITDISQLEFLLSDKDTDLDPARAKNIQAELTDLETQLRGMVEHDGVQIPSYWKIVDGKLQHTADAASGKLPEPEMTTYLGVYNKDQTRASILSFFEGGYFAVGTEDVKTKERKYSLGLSYFSEDRASENLSQIQRVQGITPFSQYQQEYVPGASSPNQQYQTMMQDYNYRNIRGRMLRAFPTYMLWLIDEGGRFAGIKLFDNFYGINSVIDFSIVQSEMPLEDTLILRLSNIYGKLTTPYRDQIISEDDPLFNTPIGQWIVVSQNRQRNLQSGLSDELIEINNIRLKPGVRIHLRMGYSANPNALQTVFNGVIAEVEPGDIMTITAQSDAVEFSGMVNTTNSAGSSGKLDGGLGGGMSSGFYMSEPRDLMVRLLTIGSSNFKEWFAWGSKGVFFSESRFGIRHFGSMLYEPMSSSEGEGISKQLRDVNAATQSSSDPSGYSGILGPLSGYLGDLASNIGTASLGNLVNKNLVSIGMMLWTNSFTKRDYEIFKRNIYPGNGSGIAQYMGGDQIDAGVTVASSIAYYDPSNPSPSSAYVKTLKNDTGAGATGAPSLTTQQQTALNSATDRNEKAIKDVWNVMDKADGINDSNIQDILSQANESSIDLSNTTKSNAGEGLIDHLLEPFKWAFSGINSVNDFVDSFIDKIPILNSIPGAGFIIKSVIPGGQILAGTDVLNAATGVVNGFAGLVGGIGRLASAGNPLGRVLGLASPMADDDLHGFDEVSFRAATYMKTVWDLFELCSALLPNYIVAVRPFEDRSTVFYGKPHWLYTSGVIPVTTGITKDPSMKPIIEKADQVLHDLLYDVTQANTAGAERMNQVVDQTAELKDIMSLIHEDNFDPNNIPGATAQGTRVNLSTQEEVDQAIEAFKDQPNKYAAAKRATFTGLPISVVNRILAQAHLPTGIQSDRGLDPEATQYMLDVLNGEIFTELDVIKTNTANAANGATKFNIGTNEFTASADPATNKLITDFANNDPITFAFQFGWKFAGVPVWIDPESGYGVDKIGDASRKLFDEDYSKVVNAISKDKRSLHEANDIWATLRTGNDLEDGAGVDLMPDMKSIFVRYFPMDESQSSFNDLWELFLRFLWQDPYNRAWVVITNDKIKQSFAEEINPLSSNDIGPLGADHSNHWHFTKVEEAWGIFLSAKDIKIDDRIVTSAKTSAWMKANAQPGNDASNTISGVKEDVTAWFDKNVSQVLGLITDTIAGFLTSIRLSLAQVSNALSMVGTYQKQANILNAALNDSIYYQMGDSPTDILRLVDNPFTREYGEPVVEIREPFQRVHFASSFDNILNNGIKENLMGVSTVVTALSDGKHPVTVHFDKGVPPERQVEKTVDTGLLWDNAVGNGLFGFLQPLLHPLETLRAFSKIATGSSDELSARRVALWHLRESLKDIYTGEIILIGDPDIRPFDLLYLADAYERMYGMVEVEKVIHHFTPETGFVTAVTPNALVSVNDPIRWSMLSYIASKMSNYNVRDDMRAYLGVRTDRAIADSTQSVSSEDLYKNFSTQMQGSIQYTHGNSAIVRDVGALFTADGIKPLTAADKIINQAAKIEMGVELARVGAPVLAGAVGFGLGGPVAGVVGATVGWAATDLIWEGWQWVKNNLLDQHGCYIQYLNKDGQPMDAGLGYYQGVAVGTNHTIKLLPAALGVSGRVTVKEDGHFRITTNDLLAALGWTEYETVSLYRDTSMFVNAINSDILKIAGRTADAMPNNNFITFTASVLTHNELIGQTNWNGVEDGDTIHVRVIDGGGTYTPGQIITIRLSVVNAYELQYHDVANTTFNESDYSLDTDLGKLAYNYLSAKFFDPTQRIVAVRVDMRNQKDKYGRTIGMIFHNVPLSVPLSQRRETLQKYASQYPPISFNTYLPDGRPYTLNWEMVMTGYGNVDMRESLWNTTWRDDAINQTG